MGSPDYPDSPENHLNLSQDLLLKLKSHQMRILINITKFFQRERVLEEDANIVKEALEFMVTRTENLQEIMSHTTLVAQVLAGYMMQGEEAPAEFDALHGYLLALQCLNRISFIENEIEKGNINTPEILQAIDRAFEWASIISRGYKDHAYLLDAVNELKDRLNSFKN